MRKLRFIDLVCFFLEELIKRALAESFVEMCGVISLEKITVKEFIEYAGISKQTFYNYFRDKADLMNYALQIAIDDTFADYNQENFSLYGFTRSIFEKCLNRKQYYMQAVKFRTQNDFLSFFLEKAESFYEELTINRAGKEFLTKKMKYYIRFNNYGAGHIFVDWIESGMKESPDYMASLIVSAMPDELSSLILARNRSAGEN